MEPVTSGIQGTAVTAVKVNGVHKTITGPVTGFALHSLAGFPDTLTGGGKTVEKTNEPIKVEQGTEFVAEYGSGHGLDSPHPVEPKGRAPEKPEPIVSPQLQPPPASLPKP